MLLIQSLIHPFFSLSLQKKFFLVGCGVALLVIVILVIVIFSFR